MNVIQRDFLGFQAIVASPQMERVLHLAERVAKTNAAVLVTGETGSGKELIARSIHHYSSRCHKPWVDVSCGVLPEHLMESELFGHEKGAFSGADALKAGFFEMAHQGTLFLDEIGELDARMQVKLLRVLDGVPYYRLGGTKKVSADVRIVAATNQNLEELVETGGFRRDLFHRLNQVTIKVPPLRERPADVEILAEHFLARENPGLTLTADAKSALTSHTWPGNIRELRNMMMTTALFADGPRIYAKDLPISPAKPSIVTCIDDHATLITIERRTILDAMAKTDGHQKRAAEMLGISCRTLSRKLKTYAIEASASGFSQHLVQMG